MLALNKIDRVAGSERVRLARRFPGSVPVSALTGEGVDGLLLALAETLPDPPVHVEALVPWDRGDLVAMLYREAEVLAATAEPEGTRVTANVGLRALAALRPYLTQAGGERVDRPHGAPIDQSDGIGPATGEGRVRVDTPGLRQPEGQDLHPGHRGDLGEDVGEGRDLVDARDADPFALRRRGQGGDQAIFVRGAERHEVILGRERAHAAVQQVLGVAARGQQPRRLADLQRPLRGGDRRRARRRRP